MLYVYDLQLLLYYTTTTTGYCYYSTTTTNLLLLLAVVNDVDVAILTNRGRRASGARSSRRRWAGGDTMIRGRAGDVGKWATRWANSILASRDWGYADVVGAGEGVRGRGA